MTLSIPLFAQDFTYPPWLMRRQYAAMFVAGVVNPGVDFFISPGSGLQVVAAAGDGFVSQTVESQEPSSSDIGLYYVNNDGTVNPTNNVTAPSINPRIDRVVLRIYDVIEQAISGSSKAQVEWVQGAETSGTQANNPAGGGYLAGIGTLPPNSLNLAYVFQPVGGSSISSANIFNVAPLCRRGYAAGSSSAKPSAGIDGRIYHTTDNGGAIELDTGSVWTPITSTPRVASASLTSLSGQIVRVGASDTITLPPAVVGSSVHIVADTTVTGPTCGVVAATGSDKITGAGMDPAGETTFPLGLPGSYAKVYCFATGMWTIVEGARDTGWITIQTGASAQNPPASSGDDVAACRIVGNRGMCKGALITGATIGSTSRQFILPGNQANSGSAAAPYPMFNPSGVFTGRTFIVPMNGSETTLSGGNYFIPGIFILGAQFGAGWGQAGTDSVNPIWFDSISWNFRGG